MNDVLVVGLQFRYMFVEACCIFPALAKSEYV